MIAYETEGKFRKTFTKFGIPSLVISENGPLLVYRSLTTFFKKMEYLVLLHPFIIQKVMEQLKTQ